MWAEMLKTASELWKSHWEWIVVATVFCAWSLYVYHLGYQNEKAKWDASLVEATNKARQVESDSIILNNVYEGKGYAGLKIIDDMLGSASASLQQPARDNMSKAAGSTTLSHAAPCSGSAADSALKRQRQKQTLQLQLWQGYYPDLREKFNGQ